VCIAIPIALYRLWARFPALDGLELTGVGMTAVLAALLLYFIYRSQHLPGLFVAKFSILGLCCLALPTIVQPFVGNMSVPLTEIRSFTSGGPVLCDRSLKFQDSWVIGSKPLDPDDYAKIDLPDKIYFVSRSENPVLPEMLREYAPQARMEVCNFSGKELRFVALERRMTQ
jgi:hypothetical protein